MRRSSTARKPSNTTRLAAYGTLIAGAEKLGHDEVVRFLTTNFDEEKAAIKRLNKAALETVVYAPTGFFLGYQAWRKNITGIVKAPIPFVWGVNKA